MNTEGGERENEVRGEDRGMGVTREVPRCRDRGGGCVGAARVRGSELNWDWNWVGCLRAGSPSGTEDSSRPDRENSVTVTV